MANNSSSNNNESPNDTASRPRRGSFTTQTLSSIFARSNSTSSGTAPFAATNPITTGAVQDHRRRMSISTLGLSGASPTQAAPFPFSSHRTGSVSTDRSSESVDESAIDEDDGFSRSVPTTPFTRRMSFGAQALRARTNGGSPGANGEGSGFNWSEQLRSRAESSVSQTQRPTVFPAAKPHGRTGSIGDLPSPPTAAPAAQPAARSVSQKPDAFQERILKGDFYMD